MNTGGHVNRPRRLGLLIVAVVASLALQPGAVLGGPAPAAHAVPAYKAPFSCNTVWGASTYPDHGNAADFNMPDGAEVDFGKPVLASAAGTVTSAFFHEIGGNLVIVDHGGGYSTYYGHLNAISVSVGQAVSTGTKLGTVGHTGSATGSHLHYEQRLNGAGQLPIRFDGNAIAIGSSPPGPTFTSTNCPGVSPQGHLDSVTTDEEGHVHVTGWAFDKDQPTSPVAVHVYVGGPAGSGEGHAITANTTRTDVGTAYPGVGNNHGFDAQIPTGRFGNQKIYVYAINRTGTGGSNVSLGSTSLWVTPPPYVGTHWEGVGTKRFARISLGLGELWAVTKLGVLFEYAGGGTWAKRGTGYKDVAVGLPSDWESGGPQVYALKKDGSVLRRRGDQWEGVPGHFATLDFGIIAGLWAVKRDGRIFQYAGGGSWTRRGDGYRDVCAGMPLDVASGGPRAWAVREDTSIRRWRTDHWEGVAGNLARLDCGMSELWGVTRNGGLREYAGGRTWTKRGTGFIDVTVGMPGDGVSSPRVYALRSDGSVVRWRQ